MNTEHQITVPGPLLDGKGALREPGWAKSALLGWDRAAVTAPSWRIKEWDYYCVLADEFAVAFTIADNGYMGLLSVTAFDFVAREEITQTVMTLLPMGRTGLPASSSVGLSSASAKGLSLRFEAKDGLRTLKVSCPDFGATSKEKAECLFGGLGLEAEIVLREKDARESMVIATPFAGAPGHFYYNQKINCQDAIGRAVVGTRVLPFEPGKAFGVLDWGRGVWTWKNTWLWGSASGLARVAGEGAQRSFGLNIGYGFGDTKAASENMVFVDGKAHKIGELTIALDEGDWLSPWKVKSADGRLDLRLEPILDRFASTDLLILASIQHQVFGRWFGSVLLEDGKKVKVDGLLGFCEKVRNRW